MKAVIVAGGKGERLRPLTEKIPKPMIKVGEKNILEHTIDLFVKNGIKDFIISVCYLSEKITEYFGNGNKSGINIEYIFEEENHPLGTAGCISTCRNLLNSSFIVTYADILRDLNISDMINFHKNKKAFATLNAYKRFGKNPKSMLIINSQNRITEFIERPNANLLSNDYVWANGSFYIFEPEVFDYIPVNEFCDFGKNIFPTLIKEQKDIFAYLTDGQFIDIGNMEKLSKARELFGE